MAKMRVARGWIILMLVVGAILAGTIIGTATWQIVRAWAERITN